LASGATEWATFTRPTWGADGKLAQTTHRVELKGELLGSDTTDIFQQSNALRNACRLNGDLLLVSDSGAVLEFLRNATSLSGVRITGPDFPEGSGAQGTTFRTFTLSAEATYPGVSGAIQFAEVTQRVTKSGGGPVYSFLQPKKGLPYRVAEATNTPFFATQQGQALSLVANPVPRPPLWPNALLRAPEITYDEPRFDGSRWLYGISWVYTFGSATKL
jgi:hypothetical protein